jgi:UDPglucose 6-dehydrogenase
LALKRFTVVITKSTVPVGTGDEIERITRELRPDIDVAVVSNPEFLREGAAIHDFKHPDRIVVGTHDERAKAVLAEIYRPLYLNRAPIVYTERRTAELIKYAANAFLATKVTFVNEIADLCERVGADVQEVARGIGLDNRIGSKFLHAGPGFGGSCFPTDFRALIKTAQDHDVPLRILEAVETAKAGHGAQSFVCLRRRAARGKTVAVLGLTLKPRRTMWPKRLRLDQRSSRAIISTVRRNYKGSYFEKEPHQSELHNYAEDQGNKIWRPSFPTYPPLR